MTTTTSVSITKEASGALDLVAKRTGMSKQYLASTVIKMFFDPDINPKLIEALSAFTNDKQTVEKAFMDRVIATVRSE
jgi:predicted transcriptional regulator